MKLRLKGAKGVKAGPELSWDGRDEIEIDFTGKAGLVAFAGENGAGKSSVLECLHHYPQLITREGALWSHFLGRAAEKEFLSTFMGHEYRSLIKMDADQGKQEGFLWIDGKSVCNGKISAYKKQVEEIFGSPFTYFRSQFCPQRSKKTQEMAIENMTAGVFRELLREFLNLQKYAAWEDTAKQAGNILGGKLAQVEQRIATLKEKVQAVDDLAVEIAALNQGLATLSEAKQAAQQTITTARKAAQAATEAIARNKANEQRVADIQAQIDRLRGELDAATKEADAELEGLREQYKRLSGEVEAAKTLLADKEKIETAAEKERELSGQIEDAQGELDGKAAATSVLKDGLAALEKEHASIQRVIADLDHDKELSGIREAIAQARKESEEKARQLREIEGDRELEGLKRDLSGLQDKTRDLELKDPACQSATCSFIVGALQAQTEIPALKEKIEAREHHLKEAAGYVRDALAALSGRNEELSRQEADREGLLKQERGKFAEESGAVGRSIEAQRGKVKETEATATATRKVLADLRFALGQQQALSKRLPEIRVAESRIDDLGRQLQENAGMGTVRAGAWKEKKRIFGERMKTLCDSQTGIEMDAGAADRLIQAENAVGLAEGEIKHADERILAVREKIAGLEAQVRQAGADREALAEAEDERTRLSRKVSKWKYLQLACGKTGLQNLRIDGAAPRIVYNANRLLAQAYGARYAIRLETQNESGKEDLNIKIIMENGQEVYLDDISGGQRTWNVQALWLAMSLLNQEKSGRHFNYFCSDESDGALDAENAEKYTALYRPFMNEAGLEQLLFISHRPECRAMADHVLEFRHGQNPIWT